MKIQTQLLQLFKSCLGALLLLGGAANTKAAVVGVDAGATWLGFMNVFFLPAVPGYGVTSGAYAFGSGWGPADLTATFSGSVLTLGPNHIGDPDPYWYTPSGGPGSVGNKIMDANMYVEAATGMLAGENVTFTGIVQANTLALGPVDANGNGWTSVAFIKDFAPDYSSFNSMTVALTPGVFSVTLATDPGAGRHVQYGFETKGPDVWVTDVGPYGSIQITAVPEPSTAALIIGGIACLVVWRRSKANGQI